VADGTYVLQSSTWYGVCQPPETFQTTWVLCGNHWDVAQHVTTALDAGETSLQVNFISTVESPSVTVNPSCSSLAAYDVALTRDFTVSGSHLTFIESRDNDASVLVGVYDRQ
jgi:hypothetical protein